MPVIVKQFAGRRQEMLPNWNLDLPPGAADGGKPLTLRELLTRIVKTEVKDFHQRQKRQRYISVLTEEEIRRAAGRGRVTMGGREEPAQEVDAESAVGAALQAFEDGMYLVFIDQVEQQQLDQQVYLTDESTITFIRLTFLAGG